MRVLLVNPNRERMPWPAMPVGMAIVAGAVERAGHQVKVVDLTFARSPARAVRRACSEFVPEVVGLSLRNIDNCYFEAPKFYLDEVRDVVLPAVRAAAPEAHVVVGGSAVNICPRAIVDFVGADLALVGPGETTLVALLEALTRELPLDGVPGLLAGQRLEKGAVGRSRPRVSATGAQPVASDAYRLLDVEAYRACGTPYPVQSKRGCSLRCSYCVYNKLEGRHYRLRDPVDVVDEIERAAAAGVREVEFVDSTFNIPEEHALMLCAELERRRPNVALSTMGLNPIGVNERMAESMARAGFTNVMCSVESASDAILLSLGKGYTRRDVERTVKVVKNTNMAAYWFFLLGAPGETLDTVKETLNFCAAHIPAHHVVQLSTGIRVLPGTPLERMCRDSGRISADDSLLKPYFYVSPTLDLDALGGLFADHAQAHPNWMLAGETTLSPTRVALLKAAFGLLGWRGPFWQHVPRLLRLAARAGARKRGVEQAWSKVPPVRDSEPRG